MSKGDLLLVPERQFHALRGRHQTMSAPIDDYWRLRARLAEMQRVGQIGQAWNLRRENGVVLVEIDRLRDARPGWALAMTAIGVGTLPLMVGALLAPAAGKLFAAAFFLWVAVVGCVAAHRVISPDCGCALHGGGGFD